MIASDESSDEKSARLCLNLPKVGSSHFPQPAAMKKRWEKMRERMGELFDLEEPRGGGIEDDIFPLVANLFGMVAKMFKITIPKWSQDMEVCLL